MTKQMTIVVIGSLRVNDDIVGSIFTHSKFSRRKIILHTNCDCVGSTVFKSVSPYVHPSVRYILVSASYFAK